MQHRFRALSAWAVVVLAVLVVVPALLPGSATAQDTGAAPGIDPALLADASWHGRPIQRPIPRATPVADRSPGLTRGTGYRTPTGSRRVRDLQRRLLRLGYRPGTRDGLYGPRTQAAVTAFQRKHGLEQDGSAGSETLALLRRRTAPGATAEDPALTTQSQRGRPRRSRPRRRPTTTASRRRRSPSPSARWRCSSSRREACAAAAEQPQPHAHRPHRSSSRRPRTRSRASSAWRRTPGTSARHGSAGPRCASASSP